MPTFINGLPIHVLIVHAVVVLVPLAALGTIALAVWPAVRQRYGWLIVGETLLATISIPLATSTGEGLRDRLRANPQIDRHAELGDQLLPLVAVLLLFATATMVLHHYRALHPRRQGPGTATVPVERHRWTRPVAVALSAITVLAALSSAVQVVRIGDSGARAAWSDTHYVPPDSSDEGSE